MQELSNFPFVSFINFEISQMAKWPASLDVLCILIEGK